LNFAVYGVTYSLVLWTRWAPVVGVEEKLSYIPVKTTKQTVIALAHITHKSNIQGSIPLSRQIFSSQSHLFVTHFFSYWWLLLPHLSGKKNSPISGRIDTIQVRNKTLNIWLLHKVYCRLLTTFVCPLQAIEDDGVGSCIPLQNHRINSSDLPEVVVVTSMSTTFFFVCRPSLYIAPNITSLHADMVWLLEMYVEAHFLPQVA